MTTFRASERASARRASLRSRGRKPLTAPELSGRAKSGRGVGLEEPAKRGFSGIACEEWASRFGSSTVVPEMML
jgi:hypothetical protein